MSNLIEVRVPDIGDYKDVAIIELLVKPGDTVKAEQSLITVESDKASMEIPSSHAGVVKEMKVALGDKVSEGSLVLLIEAEALLDELLYRRAIFAQQPGEKEEACAARDNAGGNEYPDVDGGGTGKDGHDLDWRQMRQTGCDQHQQDGVGA